MNSAHIVAIWEWPWSNISPSSSEFECAYFGENLESCWWSPGPIFCPAVVLFSVHVLAWIWRDVEVALVQHFAQQ